MHLAKHSFPLFLPGHPRLLYPLHTVLIPPQHTAAGWAALIMFCDASCRHRGYAVLVMPRGPHVCNSPGASAQQ